MFLKKSFDTVETTHQRQVYQHDEEQIDAVEILFCLKPNEYNRAKART